MIRDFSQETMQVRKHLSDTFKDASQIFKLEFYTQPRYLLKIKQSEDFEDILRKKVITTELLLQEY